METLRKIETGKISTPAFFTVAALAEVLGLSLDELAGELVRPPARSRVERPGGPHITRPCDMLLGPAERR